MMQSYITHALIDECCSCVRRFLNLNREDERSFLLYYACGLHAYARYYSREILSYCCFHIVHAQFDGTQQKSRSKGPPQPAQGTLGPHIIAAALCHHLKLNGGHACSGWSAHIVRCVRDADQCFCHIWEDVEQPLLHHLTIQCILHYLLQPPTITQHQVVARHDVLKAS